MRRRSSRVVPAWTSLCTIVLSAGLTGCSTATETASSAADDVTGSRPATAADLRVGLTEWTILTSRPRVSPGRVTLVVTNTGATAHDLFISGTWGRWHSPGLAPGERDRMDVRAAPGEQLSLWCSVPGHDAQGMRTTVQVGR
jgi:hypothetical protein